MTVVKIHRDQRRHVIHAYQSGSYRVIAQPVHYSKYEGLAGLLIDRTPDEWWIRFAEAHPDPAMATIGPMETGISFFLDGEHANGLFWDEWFTETAQDAYEVAREVILRAIDERLALLIPVLDVIASYGRSA